jgi:hypothetical protein
MSRCAFDAPRFVDNSFEHPHDGISLEGTARVFAVYAHVMQHLRLALGLIHVETERVFQFADLERAMRTLAEQFDQLLVKLIDALSELVDVHYSPRRV